MRVCSLPTLTPPCHINEKTRKGEGNFSVFLNSPSYSSFTQLVDWGACLSSFLISPILSTLRSHCSQSE
ncbi:hypothetical protein AAC387_Pa03g3493 [Persea americana]